MRQANLNALIELRLMGVQVTHEKKSRHGSAHWVGYVPHDGRYFCRSPQELLKIFSWKRDDA